jgi:enamine deaminase RidA (YjgF/YER057c/UK114 family)
MQFAGAKLRRSRATFRLNMSEGKGTTMSAEERFAALGLELPTPPTAGGNYLSFRQLGKVGYLAGVVSSNADGVITGCVGDGRSVEEGYAAAKACALMQLAVLRKFLGSLDRVEAVLTVNGYVNCVAGFSETPKVINGASDLLIEIFGDAGRHVRAAVGVNALPRNALVELQMTVQVRD